MKRTYQEIIKENNKEGKFKDAEQLLDFLDAYTNKEGDNIVELEDNIHEYTDGLVPIYYYDIVEEWQNNNGECRGLADEQGLLEATKDPYKIMQADLYCYYEQQVREDYSALI